MIEAPRWDVGGVSSARPVDATARIAQQHGLVGADPAPATTTPRICWADTADPESTVR